MILELLIIVVLIYGVFLRWEARHRIAFSKHFRNDLKSVPILGHAHYYAKCKTDRDRWQIMKMFGEETLKQGGVTCSWNLHKLYLMIADPVIAESVMKSCLEKDDAVKITVGIGSAVADVPIWRPRRKVLVPTFSQKYLMQFEKIFSKQSMIMMDQLQKVAERGNVAISKYVTNYTMDSVCETTLGVEADAQINPNHKVLGAFMNSSCLISDRIMKPWLHFTPIYKLTANYTELTGYADTIFNFIQNAINDKRKELAENDNNNKIFEIKDENRLKTFLEHMIESSNYTDTILREEIAVMFTAGTDTSALAISFTCVLLARHPHVQEKLYKELTEVFGNTKRPVLFEDLTHLNYLEAVIKESMRMYPPAPILLRKAEKNVVLPSGITVPKDTGILVNVYATHRNPEYWGADAELFRPERFIEAPLKHPAQFMAFSTGPRNCIGYRYAMMSMKTALATLLRHYRILPISEKDLGQPIDVKFDIMLRATDEFQVMLESRLYSDKFTQPSYRFPVTSRHSCAVSLTASIANTTIEMHCFICVTYMIILCSANPTKTRQIATTHEKRSLFRDVIQSLRIRSQLPEDINQNDENNLSQSYERYGYENEPLNLPSDVEYVPRRNDRIEMPSLKYRFPKNMEFNSKDKLQSKESVVLFIDAHSPKLPTIKPKRDKTRPQPNSNKSNLPNKIKEDEEASSEPDTDDSFPYSNTMAGQSQIGNRESQTVVKPTVIVNIRGSVTNRDSDIRLEARDDDNSTVPLQNIFNINQDVKIGTETDKRKDPSVKQEIKLVPVKETAKVEEDMMMCETATWKPDKTENRKFDNVFQILFSI